MTLKDFANKGFVVLSDQPLWWDREKDIKFKTPSGKIELVSALMENAGFPAFAPYVPVPVPPEALSASWWAGPRCTPTSPPRTTCI